MSIIVLIQLEWKWSVHKTKTFLYSIQGYSLITDKGLCMHVSGKQAYHCFHKHVSSQSLCEDHCTSTTSCIGYYYYFNSERRRNCNLIQSERGCTAKGFSEYFDFKYLKIAASTNDLKADPSPGWVCYGKI